MTPRPRTYGPRKRTRDFFMGLFRPRTSSAASLLAKHRHNLDRDRIRSKARQIRDELGMRPSEALR
jgi:hypothetical protein